MNVINVRVNFEKGICNPKSNTDLITGDLNSTKMIFDFADNPTGIKVLEMKNQDDELVYVGEIENNEVILVGKKEVTTIHNEVTYIKYLDNSDNIYWYDSETEKIYNSEFVEQSGINLDDLIVVTENCSLFTTDGRYVFEISLYNGDSKLTSVSAKLTVRPEQVLIDGKYVTMYLPIFDELLSRVSSKLNDMDEALDHLVEANTEAQEIISEFEDNVESYTNSFNTNANQKISQLETIKNSVEEIQSDINATASEIEELDEDVHTTYNSFNTNAEEKLSAYNSNATSKLLDFNTNATNKTDAYNSNASSKLSDYNANATEKTTAFNSNAESKTTSFNNNASDKTTAFNNNATSKTTAYDENATTKLGDYNSNATAKLSEYNSNATTKLSDYNTNADTKLIKYNTNAENKISAYNQNATEKTTAFDTHVEEKIEEFDDNVEEITDNIDEVKTQLDYYKTISNVLPKVEDEDTEITLNNTGNAPLSIGLKGNTYQGTKILPDGYTQVDYIESSGTQYIDTNYISNANVKFELTIAYNDLSLKSEQVNGVAGGVNPSGTGYNESSRLALGVRTNGTDLYFGVAQLNNYFENIADTLKHKFYIDLKNGKYGYDNNHYTQEINYNGGGNILIGARNTNSGIRNFCYEKIYNSKIYDNDVLVRDFIPCYCNSNNEIGLYDLVNSVFYANQGTGVFTYGSVVTTPTEDFPTPSPNYPQDNHVVSGDNKVIVGNKNLFNKTTITENKYIDGNGNLVNENGVFVSDYIELKNNTNYTISASTNLLKRIAYYDNSKTFISRELITAYSGTINIPNNSKYVRLNGYDTEFNSLQLEEGSATDYVEHQEQVYPINLGNIELCKIPNTTYEDDFRKSTGKNLFSGIFRQGINIDLYATTRIYCDSNYYIEQGKTYTFSTNMNISTYRFEINISATELPSTPLIYDSGWKTQQAFTFTANVDGYLGVAISKIDNSNIIPSDISNYKFQLEERNQATYWEPYGKKRIKYGAIGKVVLDGSENWIKSSSTALDRFILNGTNTPAFTNGLSNYFIVKNLTSIGYLYGNENQLIINFSSTGTTTLEQFKTWLSTHNVEVRYPFITPEITEITDSTLISQLDAIEYAMSYKDQTNISQENNDMPFVIPASAFKDLNTMFTEINNAIIELGGE